MSTIGAGIASSVAATGAAERAQVAKKAAEKRDEAKVRKELRDRYETATDVEGVSAVRQTSQDEESPADDLREKRPEVHKAPPKVEKKRGSNLDIQA